uniref:Reverse transcriptase domain-containing protein n=1 Tax=Tanacetum cinerariifolium TaxID=118510 RepID=A0A6L2LIA9_TANCI|nr:reverse transcriptase domain-containing protein [Tanacetum cinerariifolium]
MSDSHSLKEWVKRITLESGETRPQRGYVVPFSSDNDHPTSAFVSQTGKTSRTLNIKPNEGPDLEKKPYPSSLPEQTLASVGKQMAQSQEISFGKQKLSTDREGKRKKQRHGGSSFEVMYEHCFRNLRAKTKAKLKESRTPLVGFSGEVSYPIGTINLSLTIREPGKLWTILMEFTIVKSHSSYNIVLGRTCLRSLGVMASTIHLMIKFPTANGIATMTTKRETLYKCQRIEEAQGPAMEERINPRMQASEFEGTTNKGKEGSRGQAERIGESSSVIQPLPITSEKGTQADKRQRIGRTP